MAATSRDCIFFIKCSFSLKKNWVLLPLKSGFYGKIFMSIQAAMNVWEQFEVQNPNSFALQ